MRFALVFSLVVAMASANGFAQDDAAPPPLAPDEQVEAAEDAESETVVETVDAAAPVSPMRSNVDLLWTRPGCVTDWSNNISAPKALFDYFRGREGSAFAMAVGAAAIRTRDRVFVAEQSVSDGRVMAQFVEALPGLTAELMSERTHVLVGPRELIFQRADESSADWLRVIAAHPVGVDLEERTATMRRYRVTEEFSVLELDFSHSTPQDAAGSVSALPTNIHEFPREWASTADVRVAGESARVFFVGARWGSGSRVVDELETLREETDGALLLHPGGLFARESDEHAFCVQHAAQQGVAAMTPRWQELRLGPTALRERIAGTDLPYIAANLKAKDATELYFPAYRTFTHEGIKVLIVGIVDPDQLLRLSASAREHWEIEDPLLALARTLRAVRDLPSRFPDLVVAMVASSGGAALHDVSDAPMVDYVFGDFSRDDTTRTQQSLSIDPSTPRARVRNRRSLVRHRSDWTSVGRIAFAFEGEEVPSLVRIDTVEVPVGEVGERDEALFVAVRELEERSITRWSQVLVPDIAGVVTPESSTASLVWGDRILDFATYRTYSPDYPASMTDPLWMRLVTNAVRLELDADVALSRNLPRTSSSVGPLQRVLIEDWLQANDEVVVVELSGAQLSALRAPLRATVEAHADPSRAAFSSGFNPVNGMVNGRPIDPARFYRVAVTDSLAAIEGYSATLAPLMEGEDKQLLRDVVLRQMERWSHPDTSDFDAEHAEEFAHLLEDASQNIEPRWDLGLQELSLRGTFNTNAGNTAPYAATREARVTSANNFLLMAKLRSSLRYDGPVVGWETGGLVDYSYQRTPGEEGVTIQEAADNVLAFTELRLNIARVAIGQSDAPLIPFFRAEFDTEFTATFTMRDEMRVDFPHQKILRETLGLLLIAGQLVPELRLGFTAQHDFSTSLVHDVGLSAGVKLAIPLGPVRFTSENTLRYLFDDGDDRTIDLGFEFQSNNRITLSFTDQISLFVFADVFLVRGKVEGFQNFAGSVNSGVGLEVAGNARL